MRLPDFPWDHLVSFKEKARSHPYGLVDLSVGTPVDATPSVVQQALAGSADASGYPQTIGTPDVRDAAAGWLARRLGVLVDPGAVLPVLGTKELVAQLPGQLGLEPGDRVWVPTPAYPTYEVGALLARCEPVIGPTDGVTLVWLNSPANPTGRVLTVEEMRAVVTWARERGVIVASDECYIELGWEARPVSVLHPDVCGGSHEGLLAVHSLSKRSNMAGYRAGFVTGDPALVEGLLGVRKHAGFMMPTPVQAAMAAAYADDMHVADQRARYANRRAVLAAALAVAGFTIDHSEAGLYLWATRGEDAWATTDALAGVGVLVAPGTFYGEGGRQHVRIALTAPDSQVATVPERMTMLPPVSAPSQPGPPAHSGGMTGPGRSAGGYPGSGSVSSATYPGQPAGYGGQPGYPAGGGQPGYDGGQPRYEAPAPGYEGQPGYDGTPGYDSPRGYDATAGYSAPAPAGLSAPAPSGYEATGYATSGYPNQGYDQPGYGTSAHERPAGFDGRRSYDGPAAGYQPEPGYDPPPMYDPRVPQDDRPVFGRPAGSGPGTGEATGPGGVPVTGPTAGGRGPAPTGIAEPVGPPADGPATFGSPAPASRWRGEPDIR